MFESDRPSDSLDSTLLLILKAFDLAVHELAELKGIRYADQRNQLLLKVMLSQS